MKIFSRDELAQIDRQTRMEEPISEIDLMERASSALTEWLISHYPSSARIAVFAGPGNNGGDVLAISRLLAGNNYSVDVFLPDFGRKRSEALLINLERLNDFSLVNIFELSDSFSFPVLTNYDLILDGLYGSGLNRPLEGFAAEVINWMNKSGVEVVSIDLPSGLFCDENLYNNGAIIHATYTLTLEFPKLSLFFRENAQFFGKWEIIPFGLSEKAINETSTNLYFLDQNDAASILKKRSLFSHKGSYGHGLLLAGSKGKFGAAQLAARGALRSGIGLLTTHIPAAGSLILQVALPESMTSIDPETDYISMFPDLTKFNAIAAGPGIATIHSTQHVVRQLIEQVKVSLILDADALNILAENPEWLKNLPENTILTPHPVEFDRLSGILVKTEEERFFIAAEFSRSYGVIVILKGAYSRIFFPDGTVSFNSTGNPGMATAGSGDVLTGILLGLLCQGYTPRETALLGVFLHGRSADVRVLSSSEESLLAGEIADYLGDAFASLKWS